MNDTGGAEAEHPGDSWARKCPADRRAVAVIVEGNRSIVSAWPPGGRCERCGAEPGRGYAGPTMSDVVIYPDRAIRFFCEPCIRSALHASDAEFVGHMCQQCPADDVNLHVEVQILQRGISSMPMGQRLELVEEAGHYADRGFVLESVEVIGPSPERPAVTGEWCLVRLRTNRPMDVSFTK